MPTTNLNVAIKSCTGLPGTELALWCVFTAEGLWTRAHV